MLIYLQTKRWKNNEHKRVDQNMKIRIIIFIIIRIILLFDSLSDYII